MIEEILRQSQKERSDRVDEVFKVFLILSAFYLTLVRISPGIASWSDRFLVFLAASAIGIWALGYGRTGQPYAAELKLTGWLLWGNQITILLIFSIWLEYLHFFFSLGIQPYVQWPTAFILMGLVAVIWYHRDSLYPNAFRKPIVPLVIGIGVALFISFALIY